MVRVRIYNDQKIKGSKFSLHGDINTNLCVKKIACLRTSDLRDVVSLGFLLFPLRRTHLKDYNLEITLQFVEPFQFLVQFSSKTEWLNKGIVSLETAL